MTGEPIKNIWYISVEGPAKQVTAFRREAAKRPEWSQIDHENALHVARRDAEAGEAPEAARNNANTLLRNIRRALLIGNQERISDLKCVRMTRFSEGGGREVAVVGIARITLPGISVHAVGVVTGEGPAVPQVDLTLERLDALESLDGDEAVCVALAMFESDADRWGSLYNVVEIIQREMAGAIPSEWISDSDLRLFKHTANDHRAAGETARHHNPRFAPPRDPMSIEEAQAHVRRILDGFVKLRAERAAGR